MKLVEALRIINQLQLDIIVREHGAAIANADRLHAMVLTDLRRQNERKQQQRAREAKEGKA